MSWNDVRNRWNMLKPLWLKILLQPGLRGFCQMFVLPAPKTQPQQMEVTPLSTPPSPSSKPLYKPENGPDAETRGETIGNYHHHHHHHHHHHPFKRQTLRNPSSATTALHFYPQQIFPLFQHGRKAHPSPCVASQKRTGLGRNGSILKWFLETRLLWSKLLLKSGEIGGWSHDYMQRFILKAIHSLQHFAPFFVLSRGPWDSNQLTTARATVAHHLIRNAKKPRDETCLSFSQGCIRKGCPFVKEYVPHWSFWYYQILTFLLSRKKGKFWWWSLWESLTVRCENHKK